MSARGRRDGEVTPAAADVLQAMGELASSRIVAAAFRQNGVKCVWVDSRHVLVTDGEHSAAVPDMDATAGTLSDDPGVPPSRLARCR